MRVWLAKTSVVLWGNYDIQIAYISTVDSMEKMKWNKARKQNEGHRKYWVSLGKGLKGTSHLVVFCYGCQVHPANLGTSNHPNTPSSPCKAPVTGVDSQHKKSTAWGEGRWGE